MDTLATADMWPDLFQGQSFPSASHVVVIGGAKEYQLWNLRWEGRIRRAKSSHESHDDAAAALRGLLMRALVVVRIYVRFPNKTQMGARA